MAEARQANIDWKGWVNLAHNFKYETPCYTQLHCSMIHRTGVTADQRFYIVGIGIFYIFALVTLTLTHWPSYQWPSYTNLTRIPWRYTTRVKMNFLHLHQAFQKLSYYNHWMCAFAWSLLVTRQRWRSHHSICH